MLRRGAVWRFQGLHEICRGFAWVAESIYRVHDFEAVMAWINRDDARVLGKNVLDVRPCIQSEHTVNCKKLEGGHRINDAGFSCF